jgi:beta-lactamase regulating signal transducer with metallopeptidase domain
MGFIQYILISAVCLSFSYLTYRLFLRKETQFNYLRLFLTGSLLLSLLLPLLSVRVDYTSFFKKNVTVNHEIAVLTTGNSPTYTYAPEKSFFAAHISLFTDIYFIITIILLTRILIQLANLLRLFAVSGKRKRGRNIILTSTYIKSPFSFFRFIFIPLEMSDNDETEGIITHESIHASQYHSLDNMLIELIAAVMWFNPLVWMMKGSLHLVHEYLADEGALDTGIDRLRYQTLLLNNVAEESLVCLSSGLNHSLIKKRMIMMTKSKNNQGKKLKILTLIPLSALLLLAVALLNGIFPQQVKAEKIEPGIQMPFNISASPVLVAPDDTCKVKVIKIKTNGNKDCEHKIITVKSSGDKECDHKTLTVKSSGDKKCEQKVFLVRSDGKDDGSKGDSTTLYIEVSDATDLEGLDADEIESMTITDKDTIIVKSKVVTKCPGKKLVIVSESETFPDNTLVYLNGKKITKEEMDKIDTETIESIDVIKDKEAIKAAGYDEKADGVILLKTKAIK